MEKMIAMNPDSLQETGQRLMDQCQTLLQDAADPLNPEAHHLVRVMYNAALTYYRLGCDPGWGSITLTFLTRVSTEVRQAFTPLQGNAELLLMGAAGTLSDHQRTQIETVYDTANTLYHWMQDYVFGKF